MKGNANRHVFKVNYRGKVLQSLSRRQFNGVDGERRANLQDFTRFTAFKWQLQL